MTTTTQGTYFQRQIWAVPSDEWTPERKSTVERFVTEDEAIRLWAELLRDYIVQSVGPENLPHIPLDEARRDVFKNARPHPCPIGLRDRAQFYCALHFRDQVLCDGVNWYRLTVQVRVG